MPLFEIRTSEYNSVAASIFNSWNCFDGLSGIQCFPHFYKNKYEIPKIKRKTENAPRKKNCSYSAGKLLAYKRQKIVDLLLNIE